MKLDTQNLNAAIKEFDFGTEVCSCEPYGNGHINDTFLVKAMRIENENSEKWFILQRMNREIFKDPVGLINNISLVTEFLKKKIEENNGDVERETLTLVKTKHGLDYFVDNAGDYWRTYLFITKTVTLEKVESKEDFYESAYSFGNFQRLLSDFDASQLSEVIKDFHNTKSRFKAFERAVEEDICGRARSVSSEIKFVMDRQNETGIIVDALENGSLPLRVTHNDTKLNNILLDKDTMKGLCVIDLDTVMPGSSIYDFGDSIRFGANTASEDEKDLSKVSLDVELFKSYAEGYIKGCGGALTEDELKMLPTGAKMMTFECGMRFLTDYLSGDTYFKTHRKGHNLDRCRTQFKLVQDMEEKWTEMESVIEHIIRNQ